MLTAPLSDASIFSTQRTGKISPLFMKANGHEQEQEEL
jgi:hypothetical protein